jgi:hypothetical protein
MINWYFCIESKISKILFTLIYFRLIHIKINIPICLPITKFNPKTKRFTLLTKQPLMKVIHQLKEVSRTVNCFFKTFTKSKFVLTYDTLNRGLN